MNGFRSFLLRGNLVELAVAFIIGAAFATVVSTFTDVVLGFISRVVGGNPNFDNVVIWKDDVGNGIPIGTFLSALVAFIIVAAVVYFLVVTPYTKAKERFFPSAPAGTPEDIELLREIRDALKTR